MIDLLFVFILVLDLTLSDTFKPKKINSTQRLAWTTQDWFLLLREKKHLFSHLHVYLISAELTTPLSSFGGLPFALSHKGPTLPAAVKTCLW